MIPVPSNPSRAAAGDPPLFHRQEVDPEHRVKVRKLPVLFVCVLALVFARARSLDLRRRRRPPRRAARCLRRPRNHTDALGRIAGSISSSRCNPRTESCLLGRNRASSPEPCFAPPHAGVPAAARAPPSSPQRSQPPDLVQRPRSNPPGVNTGQTRAAATFLLKSPSTISVLQAGPSAVEK